MQRFIGQWELLEMRAIGSQDTIYPIGKNVAGLLIYTQNGIMSAQLGSLDRKLFANPDYRFGHTDEIIESFNSYISYTGSFYIQKDYIIHNVRQSLFPNWIGQKVKREYEFIEDNILILKAPMLNYSGTERRPELVWQRLN